MGFLLGSLFNNSVTGAVFEAYKNRFTFAFMSLFFNSVVQAQSVPTYFEDRAQFEKEREAQLFLPAAYWLSTWLLHAGLIFLHTLFFSVLSYSISGFCVLAQQFVVYFVVLFLTAYCSFALAQICCMLSSAPHQATRLFTICTLVSVLFTGYFQYVPDMQGWLTHWAPHLSFLRWGYQALVINELQSDDSLTNAQYYLDMLQFNEVTMGVCVLILFLFTLAHLGVLSAIVVWKGIR